MFNATEHLDKRFDMVRDLIIDANVDKEIKEMLLEQVSEAEEEVLDPYGVDIDNEPELKVRMYTLHVIASTCEALERAYEVSDLLGKMFE